MTAGKVDLLAAPEAPGADHQEANQADQRHPDQSYPWNRNRDAVKEMNHGSNDSRRCRNGHTHKILSSRPARVFGYRIHTDVESGQTAGATDEEEKTNKGAKLYQLLAEDEITQRWEHTEAPGKGKNAGGNAKSNHIGKGIKFFAEFAGGMGHARDAAIERIEGYCKTNGQGGPVKMMRLLCRALQALHDGKITCRDVSCREKRGQDVHPTAPA